MRDIVFNWPLAIPWRRIYICKTIICGGDPINVYRFNNSEVDKTAFANLPKDTVCKKVDYNFDVWVGQENKYQNAFSTRMLNIPAHIKNGISDRFPLCCILHFCLDVMLNRFSGRRRGDKRRSKYGIRYVPCAFHVQSYN